eukprot:5293922-Prymnesium_polylepis.1
MIVNWLGKEKAEGCVMFDESHKAKNLFPESDGDQQQGGKKKGPPKKASTKIALAVSALQTECPRARVVYCSATGASSLGNMAYMERLGLWGPGTAFYDFAAFKKCIDSSGMGAMELVALDMKRRAMYISRQLSFKSAEFHTEIIDLTKKQKEQYDAAANFWSELLDCIEYARNVLRVKAQKGHPSGRIMTHYWGCHQRFMRQLCMAMKVDKTVEVAKKALAANKCVVIGLQSTGEARLQVARPAPTN